MTPTLVTALAMMGISAFSMIGIAGVLLALIRWPTGRRGETLWMWVYGLVALTGCSAAVSLMMWGFAVLER